MKRTILWMGIGLLAGSFAVSVYAHGPGRERGGGYHMDGYGHMIGTGAGPCW